MRRDCSSDGKPPMRYGIRAARPRVVAKASAMRCGPSMARRSLEGGRWSYAGERPVADLDTDRDAARRTRRAFAMPGRRALVWFVGTAVLIAVVYLLVPRLAGLQDTWRRIDAGSPRWLAVAVGLEAISYLGYAWNVSAVSAAAGIPLGLRRSSQITLA